MRALLFLILIARLALASAEGAPIPEEITSFIKEREICEHFRGEPTEVSGPDQVQRQNFIIDSWDTYCAGTDRRLAALKRRYSGNPTVLKMLNKYEERVE
jgi:hypothetical protein